MKRLALLLVSLSCALPAHAGPELTEQTIFRVRGTHEPSGAYTGVICVQPQATGLQIVRSLTFEDGTTVGQRAAATQSPHRIEAVFPDERGITGRLEDRDAHPPLRFRLDHDGAGRCLTLAWRGETLVASARGETDGVTTRLDVAILSDLNGSAGSATYRSPVRNAVRALTDRYEPDVVLVTGDMVAGQLSGWKQQSNHARLRRTVRAMWSGFHGAVTRPLIAAGIPIAPAPGNHDASVWRPHERRLYAAAWADVGAWAGSSEVQIVDGADYPFRYSFVMGGVFFLALDATRAGRLEHHDWVAAQLGSSIAQACPVRIAYGHFPLHPTAERRRTAILHSGVQGLFAEHDVSLYAAGHHHAFYPGAAGGVRQVVMACLGGGRRPLIGSNTPTPHSLVLVQVRDGKVTAVEGLRGANYDQRVDRGALPRRIGALTRDDRAGFESQLEE